MRKRSEKEKMKDSTSYVRAATTTDGSATVAFPSRPLTSLGSHQGDHVSPYKLITYALRVITENCTIDDAIRRTIGLIDNFFKDDVTQSRVDRRTAAPVDNVSKDKGPQSTAERIKARIREMRETLLVLGEPNFQALNDILRLPAVGGDFPSDQIQEIRRQLEATVFHSNITCLADIFEDIASEYFSQNPSSEF